ncbi:RAB6-interacting golgin [Drosophila kikkawai]|uniref:RAB6-interacting golgin n=1 Tax=Drosophila kikkawai TaxID=30033 RepID=A0A6P4IS57_DROKI|nr:RAB6-interacting golgin isoform X1 [Drosophila kikkawai]
MTDRFNGFSHDEILKITGVKESGSGKRATGLEAAKQAVRNQPGIRRMPDKIFRQADQLRKQQQQQQPQPKKTQKVDDAKKAKSRAATPTEKTPTPTVEDDADAADRLSLDLDRPLSDSLMAALYHGHAPARDKAAATYADAGGENSETTSTDDSSILKMSGSNSQAISSVDDGSILPSTKDSSRERLNTDSPFKGVSLKDFEQHRRMIEEQNKQKKQMLYQAIEQHTQKTAAESRKIEEIRHELSKLESDLAVDVALLRKQIDNACIHFSNVEKQYVKIEAQFLKAKIELHNASEKKELLTEHLCTVIAHNEDRKAQKLTELMQKVGLAPTDEESPAPSTNPTVN